MTTVERSTSSLQSTARWTAAVRAGERLRPDRLVDDPWAERLAGPEGMAWLAARTPESVLPILIRTRYFDDWLREVAIVGGLRQVVLLGAGLDTRAFRLPWGPRTTVFEVDHADLLDAKAAALDEAWAAAAADRRAVPADLAGALGEALLAAGYRPSEPAAWLAEGILFYLPDEVVAHVLDEVTALAAPGSLLGFDIPNHEVLTSPFTRAWIEMQAAAGAPWLGTMDDPVAALAPLGWTASVVQPGDPGVNHDRWTLPVIPAAMTTLPHSWYVTATRG